MNPTAHLPIVLALLLLLAQCGGAGSVSEAGEEPPTRPPASDPSDEAPLPGAPARLMPDDLDYLGAFRLPGPSGGSNWEYGGYAMTYRPGGDPAGPEDGLPGSLFAVGHDHHQQVSEIDIPPPVRARTKRLGDLPTARTLQPFSDVTGERFGELEIPRAGLAWLEPRGAETDGTLHFCWGQHLQFEHVPSHGWSAADLTKPLTQGPWILEGLLNHTTNDYLFEIPPAWAEAHTPGARLATGRFRDGTWSGRGPALFAYAPPGPDDPPAAGTTIPGPKPLLLYGEIVRGAPEVSTSEERSMNAFAEADEWSGGAWLTAGSKHAVVLVGTKVTGRCWYGFSNGVVYPTDVDATEFPPVPAWPHDARGWWSEGIQAQMIFSDPADLAAVAVGTKKSWEPQPYATLDLDPFLFETGFDYERVKRFLVGAVAFDRARGYLYVVERRADEDKGLVHVFRVQG